MSLAACPGRRRSVLSWYDRLGGLSGLLAAAALLVALPAAGAGIVRQAGESGQEFAARLAPAGQPLVRLASSSENAATAALAAFYEQEFEQSGQRYRRVLGQFFQPMTAGRYRRLKLDRYEPEGGDPQIEAAFFTEAGTGHAALLVVLCSWPQVHHDYQGRLYATQVYRLPRPGSKAARLRHDRKLEARLEGGCECDWSDGTRSRALHKSEAELRATLGTLQR